MEPQVPSGYLRVHGLIPCTRANGPGERIGLWLQGCLLRCPGCHNPETHSFAGGSLRRIPELAEEIIGIASGNPGLEGLTVSGGEPLHQAAGLRQLLEILRKNLSPSFTYGLFTGYSIPEILYEKVARVNESTPGLYWDPFMLQKLVNSFDFVVAGRYVERLRVMDGLISSSNQQLYLPTGRYKREDFGDPVLEVLVENNGQVYVTGFGL